jgi:hypothetical protein
MLPLIAKTSKGDEIRLASDRERHAHSLPDGRDK